MEKLREAGEQKGMQVVTPSSFILLCPFDVVSPAYVKAKPISIRKNQVIADFHTSIERVRVTTGELVCLNIVKLSVWKHEVVQMNG